MTGDEAVHPVATVVLDTNIVLDLFMFDDPACRALASALECGELRWLATDAMRAELARVLGYPNLVAWCMRRGSRPQQVTAEALARFDRMARLVAPAAVAPLACSDPDDQIFIDLAFAHHAELVSKDRAVREAWRRLCTARRA